MFGIDNQNSKTQSQLDRDKQQDDMMEHSLSKENELRRKRGLPEIPYPKPEPIPRERKLEAQRKAIAEYLKDLNEGI